MRPHPGRVAVDGTPVTRADGHVGYMLQTDLLRPSRHVEDNVALWLEIRGVPQAERRAGRGPLRAHGLGGLEQAKPGTTSGGMRQRAAFMRMLAPEPDVVVQDEPFFAPVSQTRVPLRQENVRIIRDDGKSASLVTQRDSEAINIAGRIIVLKKRPGRIKSVHDISAPQAERGNAGIDPSLAIARLSHLI